MAQTKRVTFIAKEGCEDTMKALLSAMVIPSQAEDGCEFYEIVQYEDNRRKFMAIETWRDDAALDGHKSTEHYKVYKSSYEQYCDKKYTNDLELLG